eukprot:412191_1
MSHKKQLSPLLTEENLNAPSNKTSNKKAPLICIITVCALMLVAIIVAYIQDYWPFNQSKMFDYYTVATLLDIEFETGELTDVYYPISSDTPETYPLLIFLTGGAVDKSQYSQFLTEIAKHGYIVSVSKYVTFIPPNISLIFPTQNMIPNTINGLEPLTRNESTLLYNLIDFNNTFIGGHSLGAAMNIMALTNKCQQTDVFPCTEPYNLDPRIQGSIIFGYHQLSMNGTQCGPQNSSNACGPIEEYTGFRNNSLPIVLINGNQDISLSMGNNPIIKNDKTMEYFININRSDLSNIIVHGVNHFGIRNVEINVNLSNTDIRTPQTVDFITSIKEIAKLYVNVMGNIIEKGVGYDKLFAKCPNTLNNEPLITVDYCLKLELMRS